MQGQTKYSSETRPQQNFNAADTNKCIYTHLLYGKLCKPLVCGKFCVLIGYPSGQDGAILPARDCPFCSHNNISPKSKRVHESFLSQNIFHDSKKIFCHLFVEMELENEKTETRYHFCV